VAQRPSELTPHASPAHFWGAELRARRNARGLSLDALGKLVYRDRSFLAKLERGERSVSAEIAQACDQALSAEGTLVRLHKLIGSGDGGHVATAGPRAEHVAKTAAHVAKPSESLAGDTAEPAAWEQGEEVSIPARTADGRVLFVNVSRRFFMKGMAAAAVSAALPASALGDVSALRAAGATVAPDGNPVERFERMRRLLIDSDNLLGPEQAIPNVKRQIQAIQSLRRGRSGADQRALLRLQSKFAEFAGWLHQDHGDHDEAQYWTNRALEWSHGTGDPDLTVFILARGAQLAGDAGDPMRVLDLAEAAENMARPHSRLAVVAATFAGHGYALQGDLDGTRRAYDHARELLANVDPDDQSMSAWRDASYIDVHEYRSLTLVGNYEAAAGGFESAISALPADFRRDRGVYLARAGLAYAGAGEAERAADMAREALAIGLETRSGRILTELAALNNALSKWRTPSVAEFRAAMAESIGRQV
jgi:transcriptional regulator with XRE-family HTH domain/tetratricopeptide (TPR) repeat protein